MSKLTVLEAMVVELIPYLIKANPVEKYRKDTGIHAVIGGFNSHVKALMAEDRGCAIKDVSNEELYTLLDNMIERKVIGKIACKGGYRYFVWADFEKAQEKSKVKSKEAREEKTAESVKGFMAEMKKKFA